jgi:hypothetical protein
VKNLQNCQLTNGGDGACLPNDTERAQGGKLTSALKYVVEQINKSSIALALGFGLWAMGYG